MKYPIRWNKTIISFKSYILCWPTWDLYLDIEKSAYNFLVLHKCGHESKGPIGVSRYILLNNRRWKNSFNIIIFVAQATSLWLQTMVNFTTLKFPELAKPEGDKLKLRQSQGIFFSSSTHKTKTCHVLGYVFLVAMRFEW